MTKEQFDTLKIGDLVVSTRGGKQIPVTDICRNREIICTGGTWRKRKDVYVPESRKSSIRTTLPSIHQYTFSVKMLQKFGFVVSATILTLKRAGEEGFVGSNDNLREALQIDIPRTTFYAFYKRMRKEGIISVERTSTNLNRYRLNREAVKEYL